MDFKYLGKKPPHAVLIIDEGAMDEYSVMKRDIAKATQQDQQSKREEHFRGALKEAAERMNNVLEDWNEGNPYKKFVKIKEMLLVSAGEGDNE